jgi:hypothetical protein
MGTEQDTIMIKADTDQSITVRTIGNGSTNLISEKGINASTSGLNSDVVFNANGSGSKVRFGATQSVEFTAPLTKASGSFQVTDDHIINGNLTVNGNAHFKGTNFTVDTTNVRTEDNLITLNYGEVGDGVTAGIAGMEVDRGSLANYRIVFDENDEMFKVGETNDLEILASHNWVQDGFAPKTHTHNTATSSVSGYMSSADKSKLDTVESGAQKNVGDEFDNSGTYANLRAQATTKSDVGLSNVPNVDSQNASNLNSGTVHNDRLPTTATRWPEWNEVTSKPSTFAPSTHDHDDAYYTKDQLANMGMTVDGGNLVIDCGTL